MSKEIDSHSSQYDDFLLLGDFTEEAIPTEEVTKSFCQIPNFKNLLGKPTYYKNPTNPSCIDLIITNKARNFKTLARSKPGSPTFTK